MKNWDLRPLHHEILEVFKVFVGICEKHHLRYYAFYGTALGAIRHQGFIPWDDDFDVAMPRDDYNRFLRVAFEEVCAPFCFCNGGEGPVAATFYSKIVKQGDGLREKLSEMTGLEIIDLPYIDIFALDNFPGSQELVRKNIRRRRLIRACQMYRYPGNISEKLGRVHKLLGRMIGRFVSLFVKKTESNREMAFVLNDECALMATSKSDTYIEYSFYKMRRDRELPMSWFEPARVVPFEDTCVRVPARAEDYLARYYGDYMKFPEEASRVPAHQLRVHYKEHI